MLCKITLLDFAHRLNHNIIKLRRFGSRILLRSSGKKAEKDRKPVRWAPLLS